MEKDKKTKEPSDDFDKLNIKDHLNTSFDIDKLVVSEDLINRTLKAIKESESSTGSGEKEELNRKEKKQKIVFVRRLTGVAAVVLVLVIGLYAFRNINTNMSLKMDSVDLSTEQAGGEERLYANEVAPDSTESFSEDKSIVTDSGVAESEAALNEDTSDTASSSEELQGGNGGAMEKSSEGSGDNKEGTQDSTKNSLEIVQGTTKAAESNFSSLYPVTLGISETFTISDKEDNSAVLNDNGSTAEKFLAIIDGYVLTESDNDVLEDWVYKIVIETADEENYTVLLGNFIKVTSTDKENNSVTKNYETENISALLNQMEDFFASLH